MLVESVCLAPKYLTLERYGSARMIKREEASYGTMEDFEERG
jgi:hypothetical protein